jgi:iron complex transport system substrate-binding protein
LPLLTGTTRLLGLARALLAGAMVFAATAKRAPAAEASHQPQRIVSLNLCADEMVLRLADRRNIASITWLSRNPDNSNVAQLARDVSVNHGMAEEIIPLRPDLIIAGKYTTRTTVALLKRAGMSTMDLDVPRAFDEVRRQYRDLAAALGEGAKGDRIVAQLDARLAAVTVVSPPTRPKAIVLNPNGYSAGKGSLIDEIITRAGLENAAVALGLGEYGQISLETVVMNAIDILIVSSSRDGAPSIATDMLRHPVLSRQSKRTHVVVMPNRLWDCSGPDLAEAVERLAQTAAAFRGKGARE